MRQAIKRMLTAVCAILAAGVPLVSALAMPAVGLYSFPGLTYTDKRGDVDNEWNSNPTLLLNEFSRPADSPVAPGDVFRPKLEGKAGGSAAIGALTNRADPDDSVVIEGEGFSGGKVWVFGQTTTTDGSYYTPQISANTGKTVTAALAKDKPYGMYLAWVQTDAGFSKPARINAASVEWISHTRATAGKEISLYGTNLSYQNKEATSYVYLRPWGAGAAVQSVKAAVKTVNPYKVTFQVPSGLNVNADYEVWLHNGHGGEYGWAGPQKLRITDKESVTWSGKTINVTSYGTTAAGNDDTAAIGAAVRAANDGDTIYFPAGNYVMGGTLMVNKALHFKGDGIGKSVIQVKEGHRDRESGLICIQQVSSKFSGISFVDKQTNGMVGRQVRINGDGDDTYTEFDGCSFEKPPRQGHNEVADAVGFMNASNITITNCKFTITCAFYFNFCRRVQIHGNEFIGNDILGDNDSVNTIQCQAPKMMDISGNHFYAKDFKTDSSGNLKFGDLGTVRSITVQMNFGPSKNMYFSENKFDRIGNPANNCGEVIMLESPYRHFGDKPVSTTPNTATFKPSDGGVFPNKDVVQGCVAIVVNGKGEGQSRQIQSASGGTITIQGKWDIQPDRTSMILITNAFHNLTIYKNTTNGFKNFYEIPNASAGIQAYGTMVNFRVAGNTFNNMMSGVRLTPFYQWPGGTDSTEHFAAMNAVIVEDNIISDVCWGVINVLSVPWGNNITSGEAIPGHMSAGVIIRGNSISNARKSTASELGNGLSGSGVTIGTATAGYVNFPSNSIWEGAWIHNTVVENNTIKGSGTADITLQHHQGGTILRNNAGNKVRYDPTNSAKAVIATSGAYTPTVIKLTQTGGNQGGGPANKTNESGATSGKTSGGPGNANPSQDAVSSLDSTEAECSNSQAGNGPDGSDGAHLAGGRVSAGTAILLIVLTVVSLAVILLLVYAVLIRRGAITSGGKLFQFINKRQQNG